MSTVAEDILERFDRLPERDKHEVAVEILRRTQDIKLPPNKLRSIASLTPRAFVGSPRLRNPEQLVDFAKEVIEEPPNGSVRR